MKRFAIVLLALLTASSLAFSNAGGPPSGHAGDPPGNQNCTACHSSFPLNSGDGSLSITEVLEYTPGQTYDLTISLSDPGQSRWGFQTTVKDAANQIAGSLIVADPTNTQANGNYINHTATGTNSGSTTGNSWDIQWTAPAAGAGPVTFFVAGNAANNNFANTGDYIYTISMVIPEGSGGGTPDIMVSTDNLDFGDVDINTTASLDLVISNTGDAILTITSITSDLAAFVVNATTPLDIEGGAESTISIDFTPTLDISYDGMLTIASNDPDEGNIQVELEGDGIGNLPPVAFTLLAPEDDSTVLPGGPLNFSWEASSDPDGDDPVVYAVHVSESESFATLTFDLDTGEATSLTLNDPDLTDGTTYFWRVQATDEDDASIFSTDVFSFTAQSESSVGEEGGMPSNWAIASTYPNPFNPSVNVVIHSPNSTPVTVAVYDMLGRQVATLHEGTLGVGSHTLSWSPTGAAGVYLLVAQAQGWNDTRKIVYMK